MYPKGIGIARFEGPEGGRRAPPLVKEAPSTLCVRGLLLRALDGAGPARPGRCLGGPDRLLPQQQRADRRHGGSRREEYEHPAEVLAPAGADYHQVPGDERGHKGPHLPDTTRQHAALPTTSFGYRFRR